MPESHVTEPVAARWAIDRQPFVANLRREDRPAPVLVVLLLWPEPLDAKGEPRERSDAWRAILSVPHPRNELGSAEVIHLSDLEPTGTWPVGEDAPIVAAPGPLPGRWGTRVHAEAWALAHRFNLPVEFRYQKVGSSSVELRRGVPAGIKGPLAFTVDADRGGALRSFRSDSMADVRFLAGSAFPVWTPGKGYEVLP